MKGLEERLAALTPEQRALFEARLKQKGLSPRRSKTIPPIPGRERLEFFPTSLDQERLWFIDQMEPGNPAYNIHSASRLFGPIDPNLMRRAVNASLARHEILRTTFRLVDGQPVQVVAPSLEIDVPVVDLQDVSEVDRPGAALREAVKAASVRFDLERGPLVKVSLARLNPEDHVLMMCMHHAITDRWSFDIFEREISRVYVALRDGGEVGFPPLPIQFADFAAWQREELAGERLERHLVYWREQLAGAPLVLEIPTDRPRPPVQTFRGARDYVIYPEALLLALKDLTHRANATMFMTLLAALDVLCWKYTAQRDLIIGATIAHRDRPETEDLIGYFLNMLLLRAQLEPGMTFAQLLAQVRETALGAYAHQEVPFAALVSELKTRPDPSRNPLIQIALIYLDFPVLETPEYAGLSSAPLDVDNGASRVDMTLACSEIPGTGLHTYVEYNTDLYDQAKVVRMLRHLRCLLEAVVRNPEARLGDLSILSEQEHAQILGDWSAPRAGLGAGTCLHRAIEERARENPRSLAVLCGEEALSYEALEIRASRIARRLREAGVGAETAVGVFLGRSLDAVAGILGILKAGGAYVPLDPSYPPERLVQILEDARIGVVLTCSDLKGRLPDRATCVILAESAGSSEDGPRLDAGVGAEHLAYLMYTSGSTGRPKAVQVSHGNLACSILARREFYGKGPESLLLLPSFCFDGSVAGLFWTLCEGGTLVLPEEGLHQDPEHLARLIARHRVTHLLAVPSHYSLLLEESKGRLDSLVTVIVGGEPCPPELTRRHHQALPAAALCNEYGPTEATVWCAAAPCGPHPEGSPVPIGRPVAGVRLYLLDACLHPVPAGIPGEIFVGGGGVARGYLGRPDLTAERFIPDPISGEPGARLYRTGDMASFSEEGVLTFRGRADTQVKIRGYRIEPAEVERALERIPGIASAVAVARGDETARRLVAYLVHEGPAPGEAHIRSELRRSLPEYMIPAAFVMLDELPLGPSGKVDRASLPEPIETPLSDRYVAPRTPTEEAVARIWAEMLRRERVGVEENFFEIGGDSLLATRIVSRMRSTFEVDLPLRRFFETSTVAALAQRIEELLVQKLESMPEEEAVRRLEPRQILPLV
jgi:amino acid adenylation domain-containing protein